MKGIVRSFAFLIKELREVVRQPSLVVALILGPFLILLLFGLGHSAVQPPLRTILVVPRDVDLPIAPDQYRQFLGTGMELVSTTDDASQAIDQLKERQVDVVLVIPSDLYQRLAGGEQATIDVVYNEIDPVLTNYIRFVVAAQIAEMNRQILEAELKQVAGPEGPFRAFAAAADAEISGAERDVAAGNPAAAEQRLTRLDATAAGLEARLDAVGHFLVPSGQGEQGSAAQRVRNAQAAFARLRASIATTRGDIVANPARLPGDFTQLHADAADIDRAMAGLGEVPARVIAAPLSSRTSNVAPIQPDFVAFYAPAVLALLLQHIAVTFGALSIVRERLFGATELFRVAPVTAMQILIGKYFAYLLLGLTITVVLTALVVRELNVPFAGSYQFFAALVVALILASLGIGFLISLVSGSERQAVQLAMLTLIASVFFSGFFIRLETFRWPVRGIAYLLPVTYGIESLQEVMLRGRSDDYFSLAALSVLALVLFIAGVLLLRRELSRAQGGHAGAG